MTTDVTLRGFVPSVAAAALEVPKDAMPTAVFKTLGAHASSLRTRRGQTIGLTLAGGETPIIVRTGVLLLRVAMPGMQRHIVMLLFAGDVLTSGFVPPACDADLTAASGGEILALAPCGAARANATRGFTRALCRKSDRRSGGQAGDHAQPSRGSIASSAWQLFLSKLRYGLGCPPWPGA